MVDTHFSAQTAAKQSIFTKIGCLSLWQNDSGQYTHAAITQLEKGIQQVLKQQYNPAGRANGMLNMLITNNLVCRQTRLPLQRTYYMNQRKKQKKKQRKQAKL